MGLKRVELRSFASSKLMRREASYLYLQRGAEKSHKEIHKVIITSRAIPLA